MDLTFRLTCPHTNFFFFGSTKKKNSLHTSVEGEFFLSLKSDYKTQMHVSVDDFHPCSMVVVEK
jgi:hypothetical protein